MGHYWVGLATVAVIHLLAVMSPGPDFAVMVRTAAAGSRRANLWTAGGIALGIVLHATYSILGVAVLITHTPALYLAIRLAGAAFLAYLGLRALWAGRPGAPVAGAGAAGGPAPSAVARPRSDLRAFWAGFATNALNPKATVFFLSVFAQLIRPHTPRLVQGLYVAETVAITFAWFAALGLVLASGPVRRRMGTFQSRVVPVMGAVLIALAVLVAVA